MSILTSPTAPGLQLALAKPAYRSGSSVQIAYSKLVSSTFYIYILNLNKSATGFRLYL